MKIVSGDRLAQFVKGSIHIPKQQKEFCFELTVKSITIIEGKGKVDFSGSEFEWGQRTVLGSKKIDPKDTYGWWKLEPGEYIARLNESIDLPEGMIGLILPHERIIQNGTTHPSVVLECSTQNEHIDVLLMVGTKGLAIKENARISYLVAFEL